MKVVAGIDVGNTTTEIVVSPLDADPEALTAVRAMTRGKKGSAESIAAAAQLLARTLRRLDATLVTAAVAPLLPVDSEVRLLPEPPPDTGRLRVVCRGASTARGDDAGSGTAISVTELTGAADDDVVAIVPATVPYTQAAQLVNAALAAGVRVTGVLVERDEAVLVANRILMAIPVLDEVPGPALTDLIQHRRRVALECRPLGRSLAQLTDPYFLARALRLDGLDRAAAQLVSAQLSDASYAAVTRLDQLPEPMAAADVEMARWWDGDGERTVPLISVVPRLAELPPGAVRELSRTGGLEDLFGLRLGDIAQLARTRRGAVDTTTTALSRLGAGPETVAAPHERLSELLDAPVVLAESEAGCGAAGGRSTPGVPADAVVVDLGGGTMDLMLTDAHVVLTGCGELLTVVVSAALGIPRGLADHAKRGPAVRAEAPQIVVDESGGREFLDRPLPSDAVGALCCSGPLGLVPFTGALHPAEWRAWRRAAKALLVGANVRRGLSALDRNGGQGEHVVLVGGAAGDDEAVGSVAEQLPHATTIGRGDVAGRLGHRYAVAFGLVTTALGHGA
jgi:hypothetical protein